MRRWPMIRHLRWLLRWPRTRLACRWWQRQAHEDPRYVTRALRREREQLAQVWRGER